MDSITILKNAVLTLIDYAQGNSFDRDRLENVKKEVEGIVLSDPETSPKTGKGKGK